MDQNNNLKSNGSSLLNRYNKYFDEDYIRIDERSLADLLVFIVDFASHIQYINNDNEAEGDWVEFFDQNLAFQIARISVFDTENLYLKFKEEEIELKKANTKEDQKKCFIAQINIILDLFKVINDWFVKSKIDVLNLSENSLFKQLSNSIRTSLCYQLKDFIKLTKEVHVYLKLEEEALLDFGFFDQIWIKNSTGEFEATSVQSEETDLNKLIKELAVIFSSILGFTDYMRSISTKLLEDVLTNYPYHPPHVSVLIAFLKSYEHTQKDINNILKKQLNYFYLDHLGQQSRKATPDHVFVTFEASDHILKYDFPQGILLYAGIDEDGYEYTYKTNHAI